MLKYLALHVTIRVCGKHQFSKKMELLKTSNDTDLRLTN